ncbi:MAG: 2-C-methyl-D-erythritol 4-phosphate cytidylyltransferase [Deltaproteobacteria bacterium]|nr:2-C-methyl-D-erythritol 4-phosphate cytidylyltransferase [Deltaproteobacteria bacterium]
MIRIALVTAAGEGRRMGKLVPKQYLHLKGIPVLGRTLILFQRHALIDRITVVVPPDDEEFCAETIIRPYGLEKVAHLVAGGPTRQASVYNGLTTVEDGGLVAIHDGVRPLVSPEVITRTLEVAGRTGAAVACARVKETVKKRSDEYLETIPRSDLWLAHTPQTFAVELIREAHKRALKDGFEGTDDASLVERLGHPVSIVEDSDENLKITTQSDLELASFLIERARSPER